MSFKQAEQLQVVLFYGTLLLVSWLLYRVCTPFLVPLAWAGVLAIAWWPVHRRLLSRFTPNLAAGLSTALLSGLLIVPAVLLGIALAHQASGMINHVQQATADGPPAALRELWDKARAWLPLPPLDELATTLGAVARDAAGAIARQAGSILGAIMVVVFDVFMVIFALFFMLRDGAAIGTAIRQLMPFEPVHRERLAHEIHDLIHASVISSVIVASIQGFLGGMLFLILGIEGALFWGVVMSVLSLFPLIGSWLVWAPAAGWLLLNDHFIKGAILIIGGVVMVGGVDNVLRPILLGERSQMSILHLFMALLGGVAAFGFIGIILGPVVMAIALSVFHAYTDAPALAVEPAPPTA
jgi:predicted PurR-regulated permease PerM